MTGIPQKKKASCSHENTDDGSDRYEMSRTFAKSYSSMIVVEKMSIKWQKRLSRRENYELRSKQVHAANPHPHARNCSIPRSKSLHSKKISHSSKCLVYSLHRLLHFLVQDKKNARTLQRYFCFHLHTVLHVCPTALLNTGINSKNIAHTSFNYHFVFLTLFILGTVKHAVSNFSIPKLVLLDLSKFNSDFVTSIVKFVREISEQTHFIFSFSHTSNVRCVTSLQLLFNQFGELNSILPFVILICLLICSHESVDLSFSTCMLCIFELSCSSFFCGLLQKLHCAEKASSCNFPT